MAHPGLPCVRRSAPVWGPRPLFLDRARLGTLPVIRADEVRRPEPEPHDYTFHEARTPWWRGAAPRQAPTSLSAGDAGHVATVLMPGRPHTEHRSEEHTSELQSLRHIVCS